MEVRAAAARTKVGVTLGPAVSSRIPPAPGRGGMLAMDTVSASACDTWLRCLLSASCPLSPGHRADGRGVLIPGPIPAWPPLPAAAHPGLRPPLGSGPAAPRQPPSGAALGGCEGDGVQVTGWLCSGLEERCFFTGEERGTRSWGRGRHGRRWWLRAGVDCRAVAGGPLAAGKRGLGKWRGPRPRARGPSCQNRLVMKSEGRRGDVFSVFRGEGQAGCPAGQARGPGLMLGFAGIVPKAATCLPRQPLLPAT